jgi:predicted transcriptional regulator
MRTIQISDEAYQTLARYYGDVNAYVERLAGEAEEVAAVQEGIDAYNRGEHRPVEEFMDEFLSERGIKPQR